MMHAPCLKIALLGLIGHNAWARLHHNHQEVTLDAVASSAAAAGPSSRRVQGSNGNNNGNGANKRVAADADDIDEEQPDMNAPPDIPDTIVPPSKLLDNEPKSILDTLISDDPFVDRDHVAMIQDGELGLTSIRFGPHSFAGDQLYTGVYADFCAFDSQGNEDDPASKPTANDVMGLSEHCADHSYTLNLREVMDAVNAYDGSNNKVKHLPLTSILVHEGFAGATLISNALATFDSTVMIADHPAIRDALSACDTIRIRHGVDIPCSTSSKNQLIRDVITLLSRTSRSKEKQLHIKLDSRSTAYLHDLRTLYPDAAWSFVYRLSEDALARATEPHRKNACLKARRNPTSALKAKATGYNVDLEQLSTEELCALHLSTLVDAAVTEHDVTGTGSLISYDDDIVNNHDNVLTKIIPGLGYKEQMTEAEKEKVKKVLSTKSNTRGNPHKNKDVAWDNDAESTSRRRLKITNEISMASQLFMKDSMDAIGKSRSD